MQVRYSKDHVYITVEDGLGTVGITNHAQEKLSDVTFVDLPHVGQEVKKGGVVGVVESVKAASDLYSPVSGEILGVNEALKGKSELVNEEAEGSGWIFKIKLTDDISDVAIARAVALGLPNANFECRDFLDTSFCGYEVIAAIECLYYLSREEQRQFFDKVKREHAGGILIVSAPIIGGKYFTHAELMGEFSERGYRLLEQRNIYARQSGAARPVDLAVRLLGIPTLLDWLPDRLIYQRCYVVRV